MLFQVHFAEPPILFRFLCVLWGHSSNRDNQLDVHIDAILQTQALSMGGALLTKQTIAVLEELAAAGSPGESPLRINLSAQALHFSCNNYSPWFSLSLCYSCSCSVFALLSLLSGPGSPEGVPWCPAEPVQSQSFSLSAHHGEASDDSRRAPGRPVLPEPGETEEPQRQVISAYGS